MKDAIYTSMGSLLVSVSLSPYKSWMIESVIGSTFYYNHFTDFREALRFATAGNIHQEMHIAAYMVENDMQEFHV